LQHSPRYQGSEYWRAFPEQRDSRESAQPEWRWIAQYLPGAEYGWRAQLPADSLGPAEPAQGHRLAGLLSQRRTLYSLPRAEFRIQPGDSVCQQLPGNSADLRSPEPDGLGELHLECHSDVGERSPRFG